MALSIAAPEVYFLSSKKQSQKEMFSECVQTLRLAAIL